MMTDATSVVYVVPEYIFPIVFSFMAAILGAANRY
jgi:hypothetical protein